MAIIVTCLHIVAWYRTTLHNKDRTFDITSPTLRKSMATTHGTDETPRGRHIINPHTHSVTSIRGRPKRSAALAIMILDFACKHRQAT